MTAVTGQVRPRTVSNLLMRTSSWRWRLALVQIVIAFAAIVYAPYEYKAGPHPIHDDFMMVRRRQVWPPLALRACYMINFPALAAIIPFRFTGGWAARKVVDYTGPDNFSLSVDECLFLTAVGVLWYCVAGMIDRRKGGEASGSRWWRAAGRMIGCLFSAWVFALAAYYAALTDTDRPFRQIGVAGLIWATLLSWYFVSNLTRASRTPRSIQ